MSTRYLTTTTPATTTVRLLRRLHHHRRFFTSSLTSSSSSPPSTSSSAFPSPRTIFPYTIKIGETSRTVTRKPKEGWRVPSFSRESSRYLTPSDLAHIEWMMRKEAMGQDMFLIGPPGGYKRRLVSLYAYLFSRELDFIPLSRDTTEADIKQRREIRDKSVIFIDQAAVRCAIEGNLLVLDGIEKAERNVLPVLNNLLENREMHLEDGRHLLPFNRYDALVAEHGQDAVKSWQLERVHEDFRVVALGIPVPAFKGNSLDPPLRSRFQARSVHDGGISRHQVLEYFEKHRNPDFPAAGEDAVRRIVDLAFAINSVHQREVRRLVEGNETGGGVAAEELPWFVLDNLYDGVAMLQERVMTEGFSEKTLKRLELSVFQLMYPFQSKAVDSIVSKHLGDLDTSTSSSFLPIFTKTSRGGIPPPEFSTLTPYSPLPSQVPVLQGVLEQLKLRRESAPLLYGAQGSGKSMISSWASDLFGKGRPTTVVQVYKDMSTRELFQSRSTDLHGNTVWQNSPLTDAAINGDVCVLDGLENLNLSVFSVLSKLVQDRELPLPDGETRLVAEATGRESGNDLVVHPDFRLIGIANSSDLELTPEISATFLVHRVRMTEEEEATVVGGDAELRKVLAVRNELLRRVDNGEKSCESIARALSVGQIKRIGRRLRTSSSTSSSDLFSNVFNAALGNFLPMLEKEFFVQLLQEHGIKRRDVTSNEVLQQRRVVVVSGNRAQIGSVVVDLPSQDSSSSSGDASAASNDAKVPRGGIFYDIGAHVEILEQLASDFVHGGDHLLVIGNQGVGKNKIVDRLLETLNRGREYVQLHRDTTVQSLCCSQRIEDGVIKTEDSPLVTAAKNGLVLVVDEADKAPAHVTAVLKTLAESGHLILPDGRRIMPPALVERSGYPSDRVISLHPNFRMFVLANRPGFPFLGNNFYSQLSHVFSVNPIDNPSFESEVQLLKSYGPNVPVIDIQKVTTVFSKLRQLSDTGVLAYPFSTREAVAVVKHLQTFPGDWSGALANVFDFDRWDDDVWDVVGRVVSETVGDGILGRRETRKDVSLEIREGDDGLKKGKAGGGEGGESPRTDFSQFKDPGVGKFDPTGAAHVGGNQWAGGSGGMSTAGLGGVGGPYRLTDGNPVFQVSQQVKDSVPPEVLQKARELNRQLYEEKLRELKMSKHEGGVYNEFKDPIRAQIQTLKNVLDSLQAKNEERKWVKNQTIGDLDDSKLIEGIIGDRNVYRMRQEKKPEVGDPQLKPKLFRLLVDCSGSMYRFNAFDSRMNRTLECVLMLMEASQGYDRLFQYEILGHSGEEHGWPVVGNGEPIPTNDKERFDVMKKLHIHSQFCASGDNTLESLYYSLKELDKVKDEYDEVFLVLLSDANLERYGINPRELAKIIDKGVSDGIGAYCVFIGSIGEQAVRLREDLPVGRSFICQKSQDLPKILQRIFTEGVLKG